MKERPILFSGPMVGAILEGRKTQTRRIIKPQPDSVRRSALVKSGFETKHGYEIKCPYGQVGDRLWVRETWWFGDIFDMETLSSPGLLCPRILLEITDIRVERLQDISEEDARAEGVEKIQCSPSENIFYKNYDKNARHWFEPAILSFFSLWRSINGADSLDSNPWVWVVEFRRLK